MSATEDPRQAARRIVAEVLASHETGAERDAAEQRLVEVDVVDVSRLESDRDGGVTAETTATSVDVDPRALARRIVDEVLDAERLRKAQESLRESAWHPPMIPVTAPESLSESLPEPQPGPTAEEPALEGGLPPSSDGPPIAEITMGSDPSPEEETATSPDVPSAEDTPAVSETASGSETPNAQPSPQMGEARSTLVREDVAANPEPSRDGTETPVDDVPVSVRATSDELPAITVGVDRRARSTVVSSDAPREPTADRSSSWIADTDDEMEPGPVREPPRTGRWLLATVLAALALAWLFPLTVAALRDLVAL